MNETMLRMELYKVQREIRIHGTKYDVYRNRLDEYGEEIEGEKELISSVNGLFHLEKGYVTESVQDGTRVHGKGQPKLLILYSESKKIENGDYLIVNENLYKIVDKNNIQEYNVITDLSLELVLNGKN